MKGLATLRAPRFKWSGYTWALAALVVGFLAVGARWIWLYRHDQAVDIDEAGYLSIALADFNALHRGGVADWIAAVYAPSPQAPLMTALTSILFWFIGPHIIAAFYVPLILAALCLIATYALGASIGTRAIGLSASLLVATCPMIEGYSRSFHFSMLAMLTTTAALLAIIRSERFSRPWPTAGFGLCLGLMPLARTMTIAFVPGLAAAAFVYLVAEPKRLGWRLTAFFLALALAAAVAAVWFAPNGKYAFQYLYDFGYGSHAAEYENIHSRNVLLLILGPICKAIFLPQLLFIIICTAAGALLFVNKIISGGARVAFIKMYRSTVLVCCIVVIECVAVLMSSDNRGSAFFAPALPVILVSCCYYIYMLNFGRYYRFFVVVLIAVVAIVSGLPGVDLRSSFAQPQSGTVPVLGTVTITDGRGTLQRISASAGLGPASVAEPLPPAAGKAWMDLSASTAAKVSQLYGPQPVVAFGFRNAIYNVNTVNLEHLLATGLPFSGRQVDPIVTGASAAGYIRWLRSDASGACVLLTSDLLHGEFSPPVDEALMVEAAKEEGFVARRRLLAPDGRYITIWAQGRPPANCR